MTCRPGMCMCVTPATEVNTNTHAPGNNHTQATSQGIGIGSSSSSSRKGSGMADRHNTRDLRPHARPLACPSIHPSVKEACMMLASQPYG
mmetsp:Transcript_34338/g.85092  ORF Transcript_34338/g.85092 Transcript_34338/m.85092 type:complete len:90 (-) Transcript_34338:289-558(-)